MSQFEAIVENAAIDWLKALGWTYQPGLDLLSERDQDTRVVILKDRLHQALTVINPHLNAAAIDDALNSVTRLDSSLEENNCQFQRWLRNGIPVQVQDGDESRGDFAWLFDFQEHSNNNWLVSNQFSIRNQKKTRRPDLILFVNGLPLAVMELKNPEDEHATLQGAWNQLQTYKKDIPALFDTNEVLLISDGVKARVGSLTAGLERFAPWRSIDGESREAESRPQLEVAIKGLFEQTRFLDYIRNFVIWETDDGYVKKIAGYHQFHAVNKALVQTRRAVQDDHRIGVVWHTQGSGKSISMLFYTGKITREPLLKNPTVVVVTDRNDLDGQLYAQFCKAKDLIGQPQQAEDREDLKDKLQVAAGGVVFTTIQKFGTQNKGEKYPLLSERENIILIADEAHRSQYDLIDGFAANVREALPKASYIGFTGTPISFEDKDTYRIFGEEIDSYTISQSVEDESTVRLHYEARLAKINLPDDKKPKLDEDVEEITEGEEEETKGRLKTKWAKLEALVGADERIALVAQDIVNHWSARLEALDGKAMIVAMSRRIAVELYDKIVELRPDWGSAKDSEGAIKVIMSGAASDPAAFQPHIRSKLALKGLEKRFKDPEDELKLVIVRDMWLTGFDAPCAHTMYIDKPMRGHGLMQAIARVNRVFKDKPAGLIVDYLGIAEPLRKAVGYYSKDKLREPPTDELNTVGMELLQESIEVVEGMLHGYDYSGYFTTDNELRIEALSGGANALCGLDCGPLAEKEKQRLVTIFKSWEHPRVKGKACPAVVGGGDSKACREVLEIYLNLMAADIDTVRGNYSKLYHNSLSALRKLLGSPDKQSLSELSRQLVMQVEPFLYKLLGTIEPELYRKLKRKKKGLVAGLFEMIKRGQSPYTLKLSDSEFSKLEGWEQRSSLENAVRDVVGTRLEIAHDSKDLPDKVWRSSMAFMLALVEHNKQRLTEVPAAPTGSSDLVKRFMQAMTRLNKASAITMHLEEARPYRQRIAYFQGVQSVLKKHTVSASGSSPDGYDSAIRQLISGAVSSEGVIDIFGQAGIKQPDLSILSDEFLRTLKADPNKNLQLELLRRLINDQVKSMSRKNAVQSRKFSEMLHQTILKYQNRTMDSAEVILALIELAKELSKAPDKAKKLGVTEDEMAFYDALANHGDVEQVMGEATLAAIAKDLAESIRRSVTIDWTQKEAVRANMRRRIRRLLRRHGYPPDKRKEAVDTVLEQAELVCQDWALAA